MKYLIASDIHGSAYYCARLLQDFAREQADRLVLLGDILYHGPRNDLPREYAPKRVIDLLNGIRQHIFCVRGNCDAEVDQLVLHFPILADYALLEAGGRLIFATTATTITWNICRPCSPGTCCSMAIPMYRPGYLLARTTCT